MAITNQERVGKGLDLLKLGLVLRREAERIGRRRRSAGRGGSQEPASGEARGVGGQQDLARQSCCQG